MAGFFCCGSPLGVITEPLVVLPALAGQSCRAIISNTPASPSSPDDGIREP